MNLRMKFLIKLCFLLFLSQNSFSETVGEQLPMYGGEDRNQNPELVMQDYKLIATATRTFGTREHASEGYVEKGFEHFSDNQFVKSMNRFNQAWLLNPENPYPYLGFGLLMNKQENSCEAFNMFKLANDKGLSENGFLADFAYTTSQCALLKDKNEQQELFKLSNNLYDMAIQTSNKKLLAYIYHSWAKSYLLQNDIINTKNMIEKTKSLGGTIDESLLNAIDEQNK
jgi:tetratricopeptide (TPR) repeat protein